MADVLQLKRLCTVLSRNGSDSGEDVMSSNDNQIDTDVSEYINIQTLQTLANMMGEVFDQLVKAYIDASDKCFNEAADVLEKKDMELAERMFHSLKSSSRNVGAEKLGDLAAIIEAALRENRLDDLQPVMSDAEKMYQHVRKAMLDFQARR